MTYYLQATTTEFEESQTTEIEAIVVEKKEDCGDRKVAAFGPPGEVTVFSAATGAAIAPVGFAAGGAAIATGPSPSSPAARPPRGSAWEW